jgi:HPt (histidine-containing phosphotransfer) domain-containing protein
LVVIFEAETRLRLRRLEAGHQDTAALMREMHTLKGAASTVASPRLAEFGRTFERAAGQGIAPGADDLAAIENALDEFLIEARAHPEI